MISKKKNEISGHDYGILGDKFIRLVSKKNRLRVYNKQIRRYRDNKRVLLLLLQETIFYLQNKWILIFQRLSIQLFTWDWKLISDINECVADTHNCSSDAFCNNTHGSFNCTCKPGFTGDGENCAGNIFSGTSLWSLMTAETLSHFFHSLSQNCLLAIRMQRQRWI